MKTTKEISFKNKKLADVSIFLRSNLQFIGIMVVLLIVILKWTFRYLEKEVPEYFSLFYILGFGLLLLNRILNKK